MDSRTRRAAFPRVLLTFLTVGALGVSVARVAAAPREQIVPADTIVKVKLDDRLTTRESRVGDRFQATLDPHSRSGFPLDTKFEGTVVEARRPATDQPGMLDTDIRTAILPDGTRVRVDGHLASLAAEDTVRTSDGRLVARRQRDRKRPDWKWAGYGAGGGAVLSAVLGGNIVRGVLLGGAGGAIFGYLNGQKGRETYRDVDLPRGTEFGIRLDHDVAFSTLESFRYAARDPRDPRDDGRGLPDRGDFRFPDVSVRLDGRDIQFADSRPMYVNGQLYLPLAPVARAANMRLDAQPGSDDFVLDTPSGQARGFAGEGQITFTDRGRLTNADPITLEDEPVSLNGVLYVSGEFLSRIAGLAVRQDQEHHRLELETYNR